jgi:hypothetical protein
VDSTERHRPIAADGGRSFGCALAVRAHRVAFCDAMLWVFARGVGCQAPVTEDLQERMRNLV